MNVLFIARERALLERVALQLKIHEIYADVTTNGDDALISIATENLDAVVIGGGVRAPSRDRIVEAAAERNVRVVNGILESVRKVHGGLQSLLSIRRIDARRRKASA
jgi:molybdopterin biosynthesis enzyme MoaB